MAVYNCVVIAVSFLYQQQQQEEAKKKRREQEDKAKAEADKQKGMRFPVSGDIVDLAIPYGRTLIGGGMVYRKVASNYTYAPPLPQAQVLDTSGSARFSVSQSGSKNEYLLTQQAIGPAGIHRVENIIIDSHNLKGDYIDSDNNIVAATTPGATLSEPLKDSARFIIYKDGSVADPSMVANEASRASSYFTNIAYASQFFWLNRDDSQYTGEPSVQYLVQGMEVPTIIGTQGARHLGPKIYTKNAVLCVLDYLTNTQYGMGLQESQLDLDTFYDAYLLAEKVVYTESLSALVAAQKGFATPGIGTVPTERQVRLFETNLNLESGKPIRENLATLLETIPEAIIIWSGGKYKLRVDYPDVWTFGKTYEAGSKVQRNTMLYKAVALTTEDPATPSVQNWVEDVAGYITDDDIIRDATTSVSWPNAQTRLNFATVKFQNETKNFKTDKASWPLKTSPLYTTYLNEDSGIKLETEQEFTGCNNYYAALARAEYLVRASRAQVTYELTLSNRFFDAEPGDIFYINSSVLGIPGDLIRITSITPTEDRNFAVSAYRFDANVLAWNVADNEPSPTRKLFNGKLGAATGLYFTNTSNANYNSAGTLHWTDPADNRVTDFVIKYSVGEINELTVWQDLGRISRSNGGSTTFELPVMVPSAFNLAVVSTNLRTYTSQSEYPTISVALGAVVGNGAESAKLTLYRKAGSVPVTPSGGSYNFPNRSLYDVPMGWSTAPQSGIGNLYASYAVANTDGVAMTATNLVWTDPVVIGSGSLEIDVNASVVGVLQNPNSVYNYSQSFGQATILEGGIDVTADAGTVLSIVDMMDVTATINPNNPYKGKFYVTGLLGVEGYFRIAATRNGNTVYKTILVRLAGDGYIRDITPPPIPAGFTVSASSSTVFIEQPSPIYNQGRGHSFTQIWSSVGVDPLNAVKVDEFVGNFYTLPVTPGTERHYWFKWVSKDRGESDFSAMYSVTPTKITSTQISDNAIQTPHLSAGAITADKLAVGAIVAGSAAIADGAITNAKIGSVIQSENFSVGTVGWKIDKNGDIELNSAIFRGTLNITSAASGQRLEMRNNVIKVFDSNNTLRVKIGDLTA